MKVNDFSRKAYTAYTAFGLTPEGACGLMGNQFPESMGFLANKLELLCMKRYKEKGKIYTDYLSGQPLIGKLGCMIEPKSRACLLRMKICRSSTFSGN